jgi:hypothetical protein
VSTASIPIGEVVIVADGIGGYKAAQPHCAWPWLSKSTLPTPRQLCPRASSRPGLHLYQCFDSHRHQLRHPATQRIGSAVVLAIIHSGNPEGSKFRYTSNLGTLQSFAPTAWVGHVGSQMETGTLLSHPYAIAPVRRFFYRRRTFLDAARAFHRLTSLSVKIR